MVIVLADELGDDGGNFRNSRGDLRRPVCVPLACPIGE
jgi:hypothetical protein